MLGTVFTPSAPGPPATNITEGGDRARAFAFCASDLVRKRYGTQGAVSIAMVNFDPTELVKFVFDRELGVHHDYLLAPGEKPLVASAPWSSRQMVLNGEALKMSGPEWKLPAAVTGDGRQNEGDIMVPPLQVAFAVFPAAAAPNCK